MSRRFVLDAWALLALLQKEEPAASRVKELLEDADRQDVELFLSIINLGEVIYRIGKVKGAKEARETLDQIRRLPLSVLPATEEAVWAAITFEIHYAISYADAFAAAAPESLDARLVTGDPKLVGLGNQIKIEKLERQRTEQAS